VAVIHPRRLKFPPPEKLNIRQRARKARLWLNETYSKPVVHWHRMDPRVQLLYVPTSDHCFIPDGDILFATAWHTVGSVMTCPPIKGDKCYLIQGYETWQGPQNLVDDTWRAPLRKIAVSQWLLELGKTLGCDDMTYIPNAIDLQHYRVINPLDHRARQIAMAFSPVAVKASQDGIRALQIAKEHFPDLRAVLFGKEPRPTSIPGWMTYVHDAPQDAIVEHIFNASSIVLSSSLTEGFGLPPAEGAACGCAMVATDSGGVRDFIISGETGLLSAPGDPEALARNLCLLLGHDELRIRFAEAGHTFVQRFSWEHSTDLLESFLRQVMHMESREPTPVVIAHSAQLPVPRMEMN
jgi:glycosyltransferase involved in cell wall biosynthesis